MTMLAAFRLFILRVALGFALLIVVLVALAGCGGGDASDDQIDTPTPRVDCTAHPEQCK